MEEDEKEEYTKPESLILNSLELKPYEYKEYMDHNKSLSIYARIKLSEEQYSALGKLSDYVRVVRRGIDENPREMHFVEKAWSKSNNQIKEEIRLFDKEEKPELPILGWLNNLSRRVAEHSIIVDELINILASKDIIAEGELGEIKAKITEERIWEKRREFNYCKKDLDEFEFK